MALLINNVPACWTCRTSLIGIQYIEKEGRAYCVGCHERQFANSCRNCRHLITAGSKDISFRNWHWHEACFVCAGCNKNISGATFSEKNDQIYCGNCYGQNFAERCAKCHQPVVGSGGGEYVMFDGQHYHNGCFTCRTCKMPLSGTVFRKYNNELVCQKPGCSR